MKKRKIKQFLSVQIAKNPSRAVIFAILLFNVVFFLFAALLISKIAPPAIQAKGFWASVYFTITMVLDAGCIEAVIEDVGTTSVVLALVCISVVIIGMITFTGAVIGYITNYISVFIEKANTGKNALEISDHIIILNWNNRASEIVNDLLYLNKSINIVVLVNDNKETVENEIHNRLSETIALENAEVIRNCEYRSIFKQITYYRTKRLKNKLTVIVRQGDTYSTKQLNDICIKKAKSVIILSNSVSGAVCKFDIQEQTENLARGNANTVKTLVQVSEMTASQDSADKQKIVVEIEDNWTLMLVNKIIEKKEKGEKCNIVPVSVNKILGQILSQFSIMPELNFVYSELFSNKGAAFYSKEAPELFDEQTAIADQLHRSSDYIPLRFMRTKEGIHECYVADKEFGADAFHSPSALPDISVDLNQNYSFEQKNIIILGHNSKSASIMEGFNSFIREWKQDGDNNKINILVIDDKKNLEKLNYYKQYPYISEVVKADVYDKEVIYETIDRFTKAQTEDTSILILSDDYASNEQIDATALTYLIYVQDIIDSRIAKDPTFDKESIDVIVEIINPKNYDVVNSYSVNNVIISNRYISKMVTQIGEKESLYAFYNDILEYDDMTESQQDSAYISYELYTKKVSRFFNTIPEKCRASQLIRAVYDASEDDNKSIVLGYTSPGGKMVIFAGQQDDIEVELTKDDKIIVFSNH